MKTATPRIGTTRFRIGTLSGTAIAMPATQIRQKCRRQQRRRLRPAEPAHRDQLEVLAPEQEAVDQPEDEGRQRRHRQIDDQRRQVHRHHQPEEAQRVADLLADARAAGAGGSAG